ncbi:MAG: galactose mutarotase [Bacteroides sp.]|nr:galactose mutarotase [Bacteroides sp.]
MRQFLNVAAIGSMLALGACSSHSENAQLTKSGLDPEKFKSEFKGEPTALYTLVNADGAEACITNFGGRLVSMMVPDKNGNMRDVVLGFDSVQAYFPENNLSDFGASVGRYANRINQGRFVINRDTIQLPQNNFGHCLHGGGEMGDLGWQYRVYNAQQPNDSTLVLTIQSPDGDNHFPGNMTAQVTYTLRNGNELDIAYTATTDKPTIVNLTNHSYFNLSGDPTHAITDNILQVNASGYTPVDQTFMTTGEIAPVEGTPFDFRSPRAIGENIKDFKNKQIKNGNGYDHNFVLDTKGDITKPSAVLYSPDSGIEMVMFTTEPGVQVYSGNFLDGSVTGKNGIVYNQHAGICLETQHYPDSPNKPNWPSVVLNPGETYNSECIYKFSVK